ncbi:MAG: hypothetical protein KDC53_23095, partial [Saprospiraceae bacterium]|nr:hypothetical protein [Saprospiraceae bacterium]
HLYYSNFLTQSKGDEAPQTLIVNGVWVSGSNKQPSYENYLQTTLTQSRYFPSDTSKIGILSIPARLYGKHIVPSTVLVNTTAGAINDDGEGNLYNGKDYVGNIIYQHGILMITSASTAFVDSLVTGSNITCSFTSSFDIWETQYKCTIRENEFNYSLNPSIISSSDGTPYQYVTGSFFFFFFTTIGSHRRKQLKKGIIDD